MAENNLRTNVAKSNVSPFTNAVVTAMRKLYPEKLADMSFDNTGLLLEAPYRPGHLKNTALLTIDLTKAVTDEAIRRKDSIIVSYHPIIFRPLKALTQANSQQTTLLRLAQEGISVYCPHTAVDAAPGGLNDFLCDILTRDGPTPNAAIKRPHNTTPIKAVQSPPSGLKDAGYGRILSFEAPQPLGDLIHSITTHLSLRHLSIALPQSLSAPSSSPDDKSSLPIRTVGICAGSGGSMLNDLDVDLLFTGELSHHEALAAVEQGKVVITTFHSNSERAYLRTRMRGLLVEAVEVEVKEMVGKGELKGEKEIGEIEVGVSEVDRDPFEVVDLDEKGQWVV